jgi:hypothetical protein
MAAGKRHALSRANQGKTTNNVMTALNWMCGVSEVVLLPTAAASHDNWLGKASFCLAVGIVIFYGAMYLYFALKAPHRLQTETFNLQMQQLLIDGQVVNTSVQVIDSSPPTISSATVGTGSAQKMFPSPTK